MLRSIQLVMEIMTVLSEATKGISEPPISSPCFFYIFFINLGEVWLPQWWGLQPTAEQWEGGYCLDLSPEPMSVVNHTRLWSEASLWVLVLISPILYFYTLLFSPTFLSGSQALSNFSRSLFFLSSRLEPWDWNWIGRDWNNRELMLCQNVSQWINRHHMSEGLMQSKVSLVLNVSYFNNGHIRDSTKSLCTGGCPVSETAYGGGLSCEETPQLWLTPGCQMRGTVDWTDIAYFIGSCFTYATYYFRLSISGIFIL